MDKVKVIDFGSYNKQNPIECFTFSPWSKERAMKILDWTDDDYCIVETVKNWNLIYKIFSPKCHYSLKIIPQIVKFINNEKPVFWFVENLDSDSELSKMLNQNDLQKKLIIKNPFVFCYHSLNIDLPKEEFIDWDSLKSRIDFEKRKEEIQSNYLQLINDLNWYFLQPQIEDLSWLWFIIVWDDHKEIFYSNYTPKNKFTKTELNEIWQQYMNSKSYNPNKQILSQVMESIENKKKEQKWRLKIIKI